MVFTCACPDASHTADCPIALLDAQAGERKAAPCGPRPGLGFFSGLKGLSGTSGRGRAGYSGEGINASRFFFCGKASPAERGTANTWPTVKPQAVLRYLLTLTKTPTGGMVLDPFCGSGSTLIAASAVGRQSIGIDADEAACETAAHRLRTQPNDVELPL